MICIDSLIINITDICNMSCDFCLRGNSGNRKFDLSLIPKIFEGIDEIECITISGGEPSCYTEAITAIVDYLVAHKDHIHVKGFYIVTNGKVYCQTLVDAVKTMLFLHMDTDFGTLDMSREEAAMYNNCVEEYLYTFGVAVSLDKYHERIPAQNWMKYRFSGVYSSSKECDYSKGGVIARGRGAEIPGSFYCEYRELDVENDSEHLSTDEVYVSVEGLVFGDCNMSYEMEEYTEPAGNLEEETLAEIIQKRADEE